MKRRWFVSLCSMLLVFSGCSGKTAPMEVETGEAIAKELSGIPYDRVSEFLWCQALETYPSYYQLLGFKISDYIVNEDVKPYEAVLQYTIFYKNYEKDPDTVGYIKEAKEKKDPNYQTFYNEYLADKEMNMEIKAVIEADGTVRLYMDEDPTAERKWEPFHMEQTIIKE